jgi:hypothetical protein
MSAHSDDLDERQSQLTRELNARLDKLDATALRIRDERDQMAGALRDLAFGAQMLLDSGKWSGAALSYIKEVKRVAEAGLREGSVSAQPNVCPTCHGRGGMAITDDAQHVYYCNCEEET